MTVAEARALLAALPNEALLCFMAGDQKGTILEVSQFDLVDVTGNPDGYYAAIGVYGEQKVAVVS